LSEPSHLARLSRRRTLVPTRRNCEGSLSDTVGGTACLAAGSASSAYLAERPPGPCTTLASVRHCAGATFHRSAAAATSIARVRAPSSRYCWNECEIELE